MALEETLRQTLAGLAAAAAFIGVYFGLGLTVWVAFGAGVGVFVAFLLLIRRSAPAAERVLVEGVTAGDLQTALDALAAAAQRLRALDPKAPSRDRGVFGGMADLLERIRAHHVEDPKDLRHTRRFLRHDLPRMVETSETYVDLAARVGAASEPRIVQLGERIRDFTPALERIDAACLENDFQKLEVETEVLSEQLSRR